MLRRWILTAMVGMVLPGTTLMAQVIINEGSNRNYLSIPDEDGEYPDWIEIYNAGGDPINLFNYTLTDNNNNPVKWVFPAVELAPGEFKVIFCSGKDRKPVSGFVHVVTTGLFNPTVGWNTHVLTDTFHWDGISNLMINTCSYSSAGYTTNSVFNQSETGFLSTVFSFQDGSPAACAAKYGTPVFMRPNMQINGFVIGTGTVQNSPYDYPAPYGNWYWGARNQMLILASELTAAGLTAGELTSIAFDVVSTNPATWYDYIEIHMKLVASNAVSSVIQPVDPNNYLHTNFKINGSGETVYLFAPDMQLVSSLHVECNDLDISTGSFPDGASSVYLFQEPTPAASNNTSPVYTGYLSITIFSHISGYFDSPFYLSITNPNLVPSVVHYTLDGSDPSTASPVYSGAPILISGSSVVKARAFAEEYLPSPLVAATYFSGVNHTTPVLSVITDPSNLYGSSGIFDNWQFDWERTAYVDYFDSTHQLIFSQPAGIQVDGGAGGSRSHPQHSFRVDLDDGVLGAGAIEYNLIPNRPGRTTWGQFYLRNGSNQYLAFPYKDACQVETMGGATQVYYSAWRPVSVYINGSYFGLYELREKFDTEYFETLENADPDQTDILSLSYWYGGALRAVTGSVDDFFTDYDTFHALDEQDPGYWESACQYFDLDWYTDYIIGESWMGNSDWPWNNIKIYRSDQTGLSWRFCLIDLELALAPFGWTDCYFDHIQYMLSQSSSIPYINIWLKSLQNERYHNYFINRYADVMNTAYRDERLLAVATNFYNLTVTEMPQEYARWGDPGNITQQMNDFAANHKVFLEQLSLRNSIVRNHIQSNFSLPNQVNVNLDVIPGEAGSIKISTVEPDTYPWQGIYFNGVPITIEASPGDGFIFSYWENNGLIQDTLNPFFYGILDAGLVSFIAHFDAITTTVNNRNSPPTQVLIYPNPVSDQLYFQFSSGYEKISVKYKIIGLNGVVVREGNLVTSEGAGVGVIDTSPLKNGVYTLLLFTDEDLKMQHRFVKLNE